MKVTKTYCDICGTEEAHTPSSEGCHPIKIETFMGSRNPMAVHAEGYQNNELCYSDVCSSCQYSIATTLAQLLTDLKSKKK